MSCANSKELRRTAVTFTVLIVFVNTAIGQSLDSLVQRAISYSNKKITASLTTFGDSVEYPRSTDSVGHWITVKPNDWTSGFFPGCLWKMYALTKDSSFFHAAEKWTAGLEEQKSNTRTHDVGFIIFCSYGNGYRIQRNDRYRDILLQAAQSLSTRFNPNNGCIRSWDNKKWEFPVIIDNMMNLELLFWVSKHGGSHKLYEIAVSHALKTAENHFRQDGSTYHVVSYDSTSEEVLERGTQQGYSNESVWSRGQAWALYGFTMAYRETNDERFLRTAQRAADYFTQHLPSDFVPYWDFLAPNIPHEERDASAASIACSGLFELSDLSNEASSKHKYRRAAEKILASLCKPPYLSMGTNSMGILNHAVGSRPEGTEIDRSLIYGDYYFLEAIERYLATSERR